MNDFEREIRQQMQRRNEEIGQRLSEEARRNDNPMENWLSPSVRNYAQSLRLNPNIIFDELAEVNPTQKSKIRQTRLDEEVQRPKQKPFVPGMQLDEYIDSAIRNEKDKDRLKWLKVYQRCVLPDAVKETIEEALIVVLLKHKFEEWGINDSFEKGITNSILIYGPPGTGKTMVSESIAAVLGKNLMKLNSAAIQSQVPGQAERNITDSFKKASENNAVLLLDECDSLLHNREAVGMIMAAEINHLLTEIENFDGVVLLTTNRLGKLDEALQRRIIAKIELGLPLERERLEIWKNLIPKKMPVDKEVCYKALSKHELSGGEIKNAILLAARKAIAQNKDMVAMTHFNVAISGIVKSKKDYANERPHPLSYEVPCQDKIKRMA